MNQHYCKGCSACITTPGYCYFCALLKSNRRKP